MLAVITIVYNLPPAVFLLQWEAMRKYCKDAWVYLVIDNSSNEEMAEAIRYHCELREIEYTRTQASSKNGSDSHAFALNVAHTKYVKEYDQFLYLDHDIIPFKKFSWEEVMKEKILAGVMQGKKKHYLWPGCLFISKEVKNSIDFSPCNRLGLDTGGSNWPLVEKHYDRVVQFSEEYRQNDQYNGFYNFYTVINGMWLHMINASNWNQVENNEARINGLLNIYKTLEDGYQQIERADNSMPDAE